MRINSMHKPNINVDSVLSKITAWGVILYLTAAVIVFILAPILAYQWVKQPFIGVFTSENLRINPNLHFLSRDWLQISETLSANTLLTRFNETILSNTTELNRLLRQSYVGSQVDLTLQNLPASEFQVKTTLEQFPLTSLFFNAGIPYLAGLACLFTGIWVLIFQYKVSGSKILVVLYISMGIAAALLFDASTSNQLNLLWIIALCVLAGSLVTLSLQITGRDSPIQNGLLISLIGFLPGVLLVFNEVFLHFKMIAPFSYATQSVLIKLYLVLGFFIFTVSQVFWLRSTTSPGIRDQYRYTGAGILVSGSLPILWIVLSLVNPTYSFSPLYLLTFLVIPISAVVGLHIKVKPDFEVVFRQSIVYATLTVLSAAAYAIIVTGIGFIFGGMIDTTNPFILGLIIFTTALAVLPLREHLQTYIDNALNRNQDQYRRILQTFTRDLTEALDVEKINRLLRSVLFEVFQPSQLHIYTLDPGSEYYFALGDDTNKATSDLVFSIESGLVKIFSARRTPVFIGDSNSTPAALLPELSRIGLLGSSLFIPLPGRQRLVGWIALGSRRSNQPYYTQDINFLETISDQAALAFERTQALEDLERRALQMNVLNRITQGINLTTSYDDILELIYAQSNLILPTRDFKINLIDRRSGLLTTIFYLENDERYPDRENHPSKMELGLEEEVIKLGRPVVTQDYKRECLSRGITASSEDLFAWIGVPLNTGVETIGVISLGSRDSNIFYSEEQSKLLLAIADQAAGAIVKAGLLEEAERRATQLATLNEVARNMTSSLELVPLFNQILRSAVELINGSSGNLLLFDEDTGEYVYKAVVGDVPTDIIGASLPDDSEHIMQVITTLQPVIIKNSNHSPDFPPSPELDNHLLSNDILAVPMLYRQETGGVIEIINRKDNLPFTKDDLELLSAFASQAAVALENARLFTLTDQTLAERVEELSVLQRIDRELNTSLDISKAMRVTLEWALNQSMAEAGLIGMIDENFVNIMASEGYGDELKQYLKNGLPLDLPAIQEAITTDFPQVVKIEVGSLQRSILIGAQQQVAIPLRRESQTIGLVLLESKSPNATDDEIVGFLNRLGDHASIAITNAKLYTEIQEANQAKSDFVSFVSHELKTPMTSIRGFTDLLSSGVAGEINDNQANFLNTIRSNVDRMATLVSDLTDVSRIEAGRMRLDFGAIAVNEVVEEVVRSTRAQILEKKQTLILNISETIPEMWGDKIRLIQILTNLVSNAYKYTQPEGLIQINAESTKNNWTEGSPQVIHISVQDNGFGISDENQAKIFQKFYRSDDQKVRDAPGTGLGLNITKQLVELQGGHIWFESKYREGTIFHFIIPIAETV